MQQLEVDSQVQSTEAPQESENTTPTIPQRKVEKTDKSRYFSADNTHE
jgi:hypothetical protein